MEILSETKITAYDGGAFDYFGRAVAVFGDYKNCKFAVEARKRIEELLNEEKLKEIDYIIIDSDRHPEPSQEMGIVASPSIIIYRDVNL